MKRTVCLCKDTLAALCALTCIAGFLYLFLKGLIS